MLTKKTFQTTLLLLLSIKISIIISIFSSFFANYVWKKFFHSQDIDLYNTIFYSYPLIIGFLATFYSPREYGLLPANTLRYKNICIMWTLIIVIPILTYLRTSSTPFQGMTWQVFILAPIGEEIIFRGAFFTWIKEVLTDLYTDRESLIRRLTIIFSAITFGAWHIPNVTVQPSFTVFQIIYTTIIGFIFGYLRNKTDSIYICIFIHMIINFLATVS